MATSDNYIISEKEANKILKENYGIVGRLTRLPGEVDTNFKVSTDSEKFILKISRTDFDSDYIDFQQSILGFTGDRLVESPQIIRTLAGDSSVVVSIGNGNSHIVRLLSWIDGRLWSEINPVSDTLLESLGEKAGELTFHLTNYDHPYAHRYFEWDIANVKWIEEYIDLFTGNDKELIEIFLQRFKNIQSEYAQLRKSIVHNDANDNNVVVGVELINPGVISIIDFGDAIYTQTINDLAITLAYGIMHKNDVLSATIPIIRGYNRSFPLEESELIVLHTLVAARLLISVTKSAVNRTKEPDNEYLLISEKPAWDVLNKWIDVNEEYALYCFRYACGFTPHPHETRFKNWTNGLNISLSELFPTISANRIHRVDMSVGSNWLGHESEYNDNDLMEFKLDRLRKQYTDSIIAGGYLEPRPIYTTDAYSFEGNSGSEFRSVHLGVDFWLPEFTPVYALFDGEVELSVVDAGDKEYGGLVILKHNENDIVFYTLYGHQTVESVLKLKKGDKLKKGTKISELGPPPENGNWASHLHFQVMLDMLGNENEFPGVTYPDKADIWKSICPDPNLFFNDPELKVNQNSSDKEILNMRQNYLGRSLSLSYTTPLHIVRGAGVYLLDNQGRKYMDTVNNVAHVGHEHPDVVGAAKDQISVLNTNTRYLHSNIVEFAENLLSTFPPELSVIHFVNSGSEANELALRMAKNFTGQKDIIAVEVGYHGNTGACIDISSYKFDGKGGSGCPENTHIVPLPDAFRGLYQGEGTAEKYASHIQNAINKLKAIGRAPAGFICESIISCGGQIELPEGYLEKAYEIVKESGGVCIADEVQVGCGRVGNHFWGFQLHNVIPDIVTIGKPIGNGHPLAAVVCTREIADSFANGMEYFNTFGGNPVSCAIGNEVLSVINREKLQENALQVGEFLKRKLWELSKEFPIIGDVRGQGLFLGFELVDEAKNPLTQKTSYLADRMKDYGILLSVDGRDNNVIKIKPPLVFSIENATELLMRLEKVLNEDFMKY